MSFLLLFVIIVEDGYGGDAWNYIEDHADEFGINANSSSFMISDNEHTLFLAPFHYFSYFCIRERSRAERYGKIIKCTIPKTKCFKRC